MRPTTSAEPGAGPRWDRVRLDDLHRRLVEEGGIGTAPVAANPDISPIVGLLNAGFDLDLDVIPGIRRAMADGHKPKRWAFFTGWCEASRRDRLDAESRGAATQAAPPPAPLDLNADRLRKLADAYVETGSWPRDSIAEPGTATSPVTAEMIATARTASADRARRMVAMRDGEHVQ